MIGLNISIIQHLYYFRWLENVFSFQEILNSAIKEVVVFVKQLILINYCCIVDQRNNGRNKYVYKQQYNKQLENIRCRTIMRVTYIYNVFTYEAFRYKYYCLSPCK